MKTKNRNTKSLFITVAVVFISTLLISVFFIKYYIDHYGNGKGIVTRYVTDLYELPKNANDYQIDIYEDLAKACNKVDDMKIDGGLEDIATLVVKSFVADHFTWSNKRGSYDVGGLDYVYGPQFLNIQAQAREYFYSDLDLLLDEYEIENLPTVQNVNISESIHVAEKYNHTYKEFDYSVNEYVTINVEYDYYLVKATWNYLETTTYNESNLPNKGSFMVVNRDGRLEVAFYHEDY